MVIASYTFKFLPFIRYSVMNNKYLLNIYCMPSTSLDSGALVINKTGRNLCSHGVHTLVRALEEIENRWKDMVCGVLSTTENVS